MRLKPLALAAVFACLPAAAWAQAPACTATDAALPSALAGWTAKSVVASAASAADLKRAALTPGQGATVTLHPTREVHYIARPQKPDSPSAYSGMLTVRVERAATYEVAVGAGAWIDMLKNGKVVASAAHGHGPACSSIHKLVDFPLAPGRYVVEVSGNTDPVVAIMVARR